MEQQIVVEAAGGIVVRSVGDRPEVLLVHRRRHNDWTFPKGKWRTGETFEETALREVAEESGLAVRLGAFVGVIVYPSSRGLKVVRYWWMTTDGTPGPYPVDGGEIDDTAWVAWEEVADRLSYPVEQALLAQLVPPGKGINR